MQRSIHAAGLITLLSLGSGLVLPASAQSPAPISMPSAEVLVLRVFLNSVDKGDVFVHRNDAQGFFLKVDDLKAFGLRDPIGQSAVFDGGSHLVLSTLEGVSFSYDPKALALNLIAEPQLLASSTISLRSQRRQIASTPSGNSAFLNYALTSRQGDAGSGQQLGLAGELGVRRGDYLLLSDAATVNSANSSRLVRLMSSVTRDDQENLRRVSVGDFVTTTRDLGNSVNLGGISISKNYGLDPYFVRFPTQTVSGSVSSPSDLEVFLDGQRIRTERLNPGNFQLQDLVAYGGSRNVQLVVRDAFGRVQQLNYSLYFTDQPLQTGLHEYSYNLGAFRRQYGLQSNNYGPVAMTMFHRYGFSNSLTMGWRADVTKELLNTGPTLTAVLGDLGVVNLALAASSFSGEKGYALQGAYTYDSKDWAASFYARHDSSRYAALGDPVTFTNRRDEASLSGTYRLRQNASVSASHSVFSVRPPVTVAAAPGQLPAFLSLANRSLTSVAYSQPLDALRAQMTVSVSRIKQDMLPARNELFVGLSFMLDRNYSATTSYRADQNGHAGSARFSKGLPVGEGLGYDLSVDQSSASGGSQQLRSSVQYNAPAATVRFEGGQFAERGQKFSDQKVTVAGAVATVGGQFGFSRPITGSYAIVKIGDVKDVQVSVDGQKAGQTNSRGIAVLPKLNANYENSVSIDGDALPFNLSLATASKKVTPSPRSGAFLDFEPKKTQAFSGRLVASGSGVTGGVEFFEMAVVVGGQPQKLLTGRGGEFYVENIPAGSYQASANSGALVCKFLLTFPESNEVLVDLGTVTCNMQVVQK